jgi:hypothetical protein
MRTPMTKAAGAIGTTFQYALVSATLLPFIAVALPRQTAVLALITGISLVAGTHVTATAYLYCTRHAFAGVAKWQWSVVAAPIGLITAVFVALLAVPLPALVLFMLIYLHFGVVHFGRQNLGVLTFSTRISSGRPIDPFERYTIIAAVVAGVSATYVAFAPALSLNTSLFPIDVSPLTPVFSRLWYIGAGIYVVLIPLVLARIWSRRSQYDLCSLVLYLASVFFFLPLFITSDPLIAVTSWTTAHGLQYLVFLGFHAGRTARKGLFGWVSVAILLGAGGAGYIIWQAAATAQIDGWIGPGFMRAAAAVVLALTLAHYWVDMFLWRFRNAERRRWLTDGYPFLVRTIELPTPPSVDARSIIAGTLSAR